MFTHELIEHTDSIDFRISFNGKQVGELVVSNNGFIDYYNNIDNEARYNLLTLSSNGTIENDVPTPE